MARITFTIGEKARIVNKDYAFAPCTVVIKEDRKKGKAIVQIIEATQADFVCERGWLVELKDLKKMDKRPDIE